MKIRQIKVTIYEHSKINDNNKKTWESIYGKSMNIYNENAEAKMKAK